jgi:acetyl-CoA C-acetyltransferase
MESMSQAPHLLLGSRDGVKYGDWTMVDSMAFDALTCSFDMCAMGEATENYNERYSLTREEQDAFAAQSHQRAAEATKNGIFDDEIAPVFIPQRKGDPIEFTTDEGIRPDTTAESLGRLRPAFAKDGTITAATSSSISDGAAAVVLARQSVAESKGLVPVARIIAAAAHAHAPALFTTAPIPAIRKVLDKAGWSVDDVDLFEVNEAFACVAMFAMRDLGIPHDKINVNGGGTALGHPIGASGTRIIVTLLNALKERGKKRGIASLCIGGGEATAVAIELI